MAGDYGRQSGLVFGDVSAHTYLPSPWGEYNPYGFPLGLISLQSLPGYDAHAKKALQQLKKGFSPWALGSIYLPANVTFFCQAS